MKVVLSEKQLQEIILLESGTRNGGNGNYANSNIRNYSPLKRRNDMDMGNFSQLLSLLPSDDTTNIDMNQNPTGWLNIVSYVFKLYTGPLFHGRYNQGVYGNLPGVGSVRADCSGFIYACLRKAGFNVPQIATSQIVNNDASFTNLIRGGFTKVQWNKPGTAQLTQGGNLPPGTILARPGHVTVYAGGNLCWDFGNNRRYTDGKPVSGNGILNKPFTYAWIPNSRLS